MDQHKIENYEKVYGAKSFPAFRKLPSNEADCLMQDLLIYLDLPAHSSDIAINEKVKEKGSVIEHFNIENEDFKLDSLLHKYNFQTTGICYLNWLNYRDLDEININDLCHHFFDIWYPIVDDLNIFFPEHKTILSVHHYGVIQYLDLSSR